MNNKGFVLVVSAPSGCGKDTIIEKVLQKMNGEAVLSVSMTTRAMREGEQEGVNYFYVSKDEFFRHIEDGDMLEYTNYGSNYYGTPIKPVKDQLEKGKIVILIIEVEGGGNVKKAFPDAKKIFVIPPSMKILEQRLRSRGTDSDEAICKRMTIAECELKRACEYDYIVENDDLNEAVEDVLAIIKAEQLKIDNMKNKLKEVMNYA
ncbi:MAG: guanylate kinase [Acutalibacteraceae bacterium]|nr:guanylate kinase [Acutalibacteraceae bacterium]